MLVVNSAGVEICLIAYLDGCGYGRPTRLDDGEKCHLHGPRKSAILLVTQEYHTIEGAVEFLPEESPLPNVFKVPDPDQFSCIPIMKGDVQIGCLYVWRFRSGYRPGLPLR